MSPAVGQTSLSALSALLVLYLGSGFTQNFQGGTLDMEPPSLV